MDRARSLIILSALLLVLCGRQSKAQTFSLRKVHDSLYWLNEWRLPYPVYRFETGDIDGDGQTDAIVGVIKSTRFYPERGRRLFIFKMVDVQAHVAVVMHNQQAEKHVLAHVLIIYQEVKDIASQHPVIVLENIHITITLIVHHNVLHHVQIIIIHIQIVINV